MLNPLRKILSRGEVATLMSVRQLKTVDAPLIIKQSGFDGFYIDCEHGLFSTREVSDLCIAAAAVELTALVRVHSVSVGTLGPVLDAGAAGVIIPHVNNAAEAAAAVRLCKYPPMGVRSMAALGPSSGYQKISTPQLIAQRDAAVMVIAMIETAEGVENADQISAVDGIDALMMGPMDLSLDMGIPGELRHPKICEAYLKALSGAKASGKHFIGGDSGGPSVAELLKHGARILLGGSDTAYFLQALTQANKNLQAEINQ
jgi:2-keto-3-deoxy-L-rhamnonate aldolase RhmA